MTAIMTTDPHRGQPIRHRGVEPAAARLIVVCVHGRGASAADILSVADELHATDVAYLAPEAAGQTWYPYSFLAPIEDNQPYLDSALGVLAAIVDDLRAQQIPGERVALLGFSQGACLALEFAARHAQRYAAICAVAASSCPTSLCPARSAFIRRGCSERPSSSGAATSIRTFPWRACRRARSCSARSAPRSTPGSIRAWDTRSTAMNCERRARFSRAASRLHVAQPFRAARTRLFIPAAGR